MAKHNPALQADPGLHGFARLGIGAYFAPVQVLPPGAAERYHVIYSLESQAVKATLPDIR